MYNFTIYIIFCTCSKERYVRGKISFRDTDVLKRSLAQPNVPHNVLKRTLAYSNVLYPAQSQYLTSFTAGKRQVHSSTNVDKFHRKNVRYPALFEKQAHNGRTMPRAGCYTPLGVAKYTIAGRSSAQSSIEGTVVYRTQAQSDVPLCTCPWASRTRISVVYCTLTWCTLL